VSGNACDRCPTTEQWAALHEDLGSIKSTLMTMDRRLARLEEDADDTAEDDVQALRDEIASLHAREARLADFRRDVGKAVAIALLSAALGVLGGAAAKGAPRTASPPTTTLGAGGAPAPFAYPPPPK
jgi:hypothetical protein